MCSWVFIISTSTELAFVKTPCGPFEVRLLHCTRLLTASFIVAQVRFLHLATVVPHLRAKVRFYLHILLSSLPSPLPTSPGVLSSPVGLYPSPHSHVRGPCLGSPCSFRFASLRLVVVPRMLPHPIPVYAPVCFSPPVAMFVTVGWVREVC